MARYLAVWERLLVDIAGGAIAPGTAIPSVRELARREGVAPTTAARVHGELARQGVTAGSPRRRAVVTPDGPQRARRALAGGRALRLAGSDDPLLDLLLAGRTDVDRVAGRGSFAGLTALWAGTADAATLHLRHRDGTYNAPFAGSVLAGRDPQLVPLWRREQGLLVAAGNPRGVEGVAALDRHTVALRAPGTGTRALLDRLVTEAGAGPAALRGPVHGSHLEIAMAVATGSADTGMATRAAAATFGLGFVRVAWEPFELALPRDALELAEPLIEAIRVDGAVLAQRLGGYELLA
jgi:putative molybdopterin biosynthesis protein